MDCPNCGGPTRCIRYPQLVDAAFASDGQTTERRLAWVCPKCYPDLVRKYGNG